MRPQTRILDKPLCGHALCTIPWVVPTLQIEVKFFTAVQHQMVSSVCGNLPPMATLTTTGHLFSQHLYQPWVTISVIPVFETQCVSTRDRPRPQTSVLAPHHSHYTFVPSQVSEGRQSGPTPALQMFNHPQGKPESQPASGPVKVRVQLVRGWFSPSTVWALGLKFKLSGWPESLLARQTSNQVPQ